MRQRTGSAYRSLRRKALAGVAALAVVGLTASTAVAAGGIGSRGIGDPYYPDYGNGGYDVDHYAIAVSYQPATDRLTGTTHITAHSTQALRRFNLDFALTASSVKVNGRTAEFNQPYAHELVVTPAVALRQGDSLDVEVTYAGTPSAVTSHGISPWIRTDDGALALGEPEISAWWFPANDHPQDKATYDIAVTVPSGVEALSNGRLLSTTKALSGDTWTWRESTPMATYLAYMAVGQFDITKGTANGLPWLNAVASNGGLEGERAAADLARTPEIVDFHSQYFGPYPHEAMGGVAPAASFGFALENQTRPVYSRLFWSDGSNIYVLVHELAHQWYGDSVSVEDWRDIWLNEGFATFSTWNWSEKHGEGTGNEILKYYYQDIKASDPFWNFSIGDPGPGREFAGQVYTRGAMTLQALRNRVGDATFFGILREWASSHRYGNGSIPEFIALAERRSGQKLAAFFVTWLFTPERPAATVANGLRPGWDDATAAKESAPSSVTKIDKAIQASMASRR